jgi:hypothetical protein
MWLIFLVFCIVFLCFVCLRPVSCVPNVVSVSGLSSSIQRHWQHWADKTQDEDNPETLTTLGRQDTGRRQSWEDCLRPASCLPNVVSVSGLSSSCVLSAQCCQCLRIVFVLRPKTILRHWQHGADKTQDEDNPETLTTLGRQDAGRRQSWDTDNIGQTRRLPNVVSVSGLSSSCVLSAQCCQCLRIVFVLCLVCPMLSVIQDGDKQNTNT